MGLYQVNQKNFLAYEELPIIMALKGRDIKDFKLFIKNEQNPEGVFVLANARPLRDVNGEIAGALATCRNITKSVNKERKMLEERYFYQKILDLIPACITVQDLSLNYIFTNKYFSDNFYPESAEGKMTKEIYNKQDGDLIQSHNERVLTTKKEMMFEEKIQHLDGSIHHYRTVRFPLLNNRREIDAICSLALDETQEIAQKKEIEAERIKNINASKLAALGTLAAEIGHEINNPLGIIKTSSLVLKHMIQDSAPMEMIQNQVDIIDKTTTRIIEIVSALKHVSRDSQDEKKSIFSLQEILNDVDALCSTGFKLKDIHLSVVDSKSILDKKVKGMRVQLSQVLLNLLMNASDAIEEMKEPWVKIIIDEDTEFYYFKVIDSGAGVPLELQSKIFEPFFTTKSLGTGTGLGLSISKDIMRRQKGDLYLDTSSNKSTFVIKLPK
jgi:signal transduction histidine kinase